MSGYTTRSFSTVVPVNGTNKRYPIGSATPNQTLTSTVDYGIEQSVYSKGNPYPYVEGGDFDVTTSYRFTRGLLTGEMQTSLYRHVLDRYGFSAATSYTPPAFGAVDTVNTVLARTNPSRPVVDLPIFIFELREVPQMFVNEGRTLIKKIANHNLSWEFAWKPLISDLRELFNFQASVDRRVSYLSSLHKKGGARFEREVYKDEFTGPESLATIISYSAKECGRVYRIPYYKRRRWVSVSWVPSYNPRSGIPSINVIRRQAFQSVLGLTIDPSTVWNALPWTWLIDWFSDVGDYLVANRNLVGFQPGTCYQMDHTISGHKYDVRMTYGSWSKVEPPSSLTEVKHRTASAGTTTPTAFVPILTGRQLGILASLLAKRT